MRHVRLLAVASAFVVAATAPLFAAQPALPAPTITFEPQALVISAVEPGEPVALFGVNLVRKNGAAYNERVKLIIAADGSGVARFELESPVNLFSRWAVVGLSSGAYRLAAPPDSPLRVWTEIREEVRPGHSGLVDFVVSSRPFVELFVVSPRHGAWHTATGDGFGTDGDGTANGKTTVSLDALSPLDPSYQALRTLRPGDVIVVIDSHSFDYSVQVVNP